MNPRTLYVSDMDGTLLDASSQVSARSAAMLNRAIENGAAFTVATARTPATVAPLLAGVHMSLPAIVMTGAALWHFAEKRFSDPRFISEDEVRRLIEIYRSEGLPHFIYTLNGDKIDIYHRGGLSPLDREFIDARTNNPVKNLIIGPDGESPMPGRTDNVLLLYTMREPEKVERVYNRIRTECSCTPIFYYDIFGPDTAILEVFAQGCTKAAAMKRMASDTGAARTVAFGDNLNDIPMLRAADVAVAVGNAAPQVKEIADVVIADNTSDAVARWILQDMGLPCDFNS